MQADWNAIKAEYITTSISYRQLARKADVPFRTLAYHAKQEAWPAARAAYKDKTLRATVRQISEKTAEDNAEKLLQLQSATDSLVQVVNAVFADTEQFRRHIVTEHTGKSETRVEERVLQKADTKAIKEMTAALKDLAFVVRNLYDLPTKQEQSAMDMAAARLRQEQADADAGDDTVTVNFEGDDAEAWSK